MISRTASFERNTPEAFKSNRESGLAQVAPFNDGWQMLLLGWIQFLIVTIWPRLPKNEKRPTVTQALILV
ncbi:MAG: hypothetical protein R8M11_04740 [Gallionella sp.]